MKPAYLIVGDDRAKVDQAVNRLREVAEKDSGDIEILRGEGSGPASPAAVEGAVSMMSLAGGRRYIIVPDAQAWNAADTKTVAATIANLPPEVTLALVGHESSDKKSAKVGKPIRDAVEKVGKIIEYRVPKPGEMTSWVRAEAQARKFTIDQPAAALLVERLGDNTARLGNELDRLATWVGEGGHIGLEELADTIADTSEDAIWTLADAVVEGDRVKAMVAAERIVDAGDSPAPMLLIAAKKLRETSRAAAIVAAGGGENEIRAELKIHPYAAKLLARRVRGASPMKLRRAACAVADIEWWTRGGGDWDPDTALTIGIMRATASK